MVRKTEGRLKFTLTDLKSLTGLSMENVRTCNLSFQSKALI